MISDELIIKMCTNLFVEEFKNAILKAKGSYLDILEKVTTAHYKTTKLNKDNDINSMFCIAVLLQNRKGLLVIPQETFNQYFNTIKK